MPLRLIHRPADNRVYLLLLPGLAVAVSIAVLPRRPARRALADWLGRVDERWYWLYQGALCRLGEDPDQADRMYSPTST
ncbi:hypothetical protein [Streptomyces sp. NBC_01803]|uniref:hypothetical protein n=1 Tax=Streptomyces sp. NBC_01803 TaxID=2975946 RepID=UPI002DD8525C|nr:hypothetical protein [Streptomyces sp. NBC_01803]WSA46907.1 hypothetical protein OIE51_23650 [Streptomyces sp. NBC_01803]